MEGHVSYKSVHTNLESSGNALGLGGHKGYLSNSKLFCYFWNEFNSYRGEKKTLELVAIESIIASMLLQHYLNWERYVLGLSIASIYSKEQATQTIPFDFSAYMIQETDNKTLKINEIPMNVV